MNCKNFFSVTIATLMVVLSAVTSYAYPTNSADSVKDEMKQASEQFVIYIDANGDYIFHNVPKFNSKSSSLFPIKIDQTKEVREQINNYVFSKTARANTYHTEKNPVHIGTWGGIKAYARHTLGSQSGMNLTTKGDATWYNTNGHTALPYRNGNATVKEHIDQVDVEPGTNFTVTATNTGESITVAVDDFGPNQKSNPGNKTIVDLDKSDFATLFGKASIGRSHCTTVVEVQQFFN